MAKKTMGKNIQWELTKAGMLNISIDTTKDFGPSKSEKTITIASTQGNKQLEGTEVYLGVNCYKYPDRD
jgi:hypothetical protein